MSAERCPVPHCAGTLWADYDPETREWSLACRLCGRSPNPPPAHVERVPDRSLPRMTGSRAGAR
jgi:hypothetical protein